MRYLRKHITERLRSERGASITVVLLLFLVCLAVSSIVLAAATTTSGRLAELVSMDRRYYDVTSAQDLLWGQIDAISYKAAEGSDPAEDNRIVITRSCTLTLNADGEYEATNFTATLNGSALGTTYNPSAHTLLETLAVDTVFPGSSTLLSAIRTLNIESTFDTTDIADPKFSETPQAGRTATTYNPLAVTVTNGTYSPSSELSKALRSKVAITSEPNGDLRFIISSDIHDDRDIYSTEFVAKSAIDEEMPDLKRTGDDTYELTCTTYVTWEPIAS